MTEKKEKKEKKPRKPSLKTLARSPEPLSNASSEREACQKCELFKHCKTPFLKPWVPKEWTGRALLVGEAPGEDEDEKSKRPFTGRAGKLLARMLREAGYQPNDVALVNACRCRPRKNAAPNMTQIRACRPFLLRAIEHLSPKSIIALGATAKRALRDDGDENVTKWRGRLITIPRATEDDKEGKIPIPAWITYHPAAILHGAAYLEERIVEDLKREEWENLPYPRDHIPKLGAKTLGFDTEYDKNGSILTIGMSTSEDACALEFEGSSGITFETFGETLETAEYLIGHNITVDIDQLVKLGLAKPEWVSGEKLLDSLLLSRMVNENREKGGYGLEALTCSEFKVEPWKDETDALFEKTGDAADWPVELRTERCRLDAWASYQLAKLYTPQVPEKLRVFTNKIAAVLHRIYLAGAAVDIPRLEELGQGWRAEANEARDKLTKAALATGMEEFIPTDDKHLRELVYKRLGCPVTEKTEKTKEPKVDKTTLKQFASNHEAIKLLIEFNRADKLASTWYGSEKENKNRKPSLRESVISVRDGVGMLRFQLNALKAKTGRRTGGGDDEEKQDGSSRNSQNWPKIARGIVRSRWDGGKIAACDFERLEVVLMAWVAGDDKLLHYFTEGEGYIGVGKLLFGKEVEKGTEDYRTIKSIILGTGYNMKKRYLAWNLWNKANVKLDSNYDTHIDMAGELREKYLRTFPGIARYIKRQSKTVELKQQVVSPAGRVRRLPHNGPRSEMYWRAENQGVNFPIQSFASDVTGSALIDVESAILAEHKISLVEWYEMLIRDPLDLPCSVLINEVHDELTGDLHPDTGNRDLEIMVETMRAVPSLRELVPSFDIKIGVDPTVGDRWGVGE
jgi:DNA polymerase